MLVLAVVAGWAFASDTVPTTREIAPGVHMPYVNCGGVHSHPSNFTAWMMDAGGRGLDTALMYGDDVQLRMGNAIKKGRTVSYFLLLPSRIGYVPGEIASCTYARSLFRSVALKWPDFFAFYGKIFCTMCTGQVTTL